MTGRGQKQQLRFKIASNISEARPSGPSSSRAELYLAGLSMDILLKMFMEIELPEAGPLEIHRGRPFHTIGAFDAAILRAFEEEPGVIRGTNQMEYENGDIRVFPIRSIENVREAIGLIRDQGEGTSTSPFPPGETEPDHYYRFGQMYHQRKIIPVAGGWDYLGGPVTFPSVYPVKRVPKRGYNIRETQEFRRLYSAMLDDLQRAFETVDQALVELARQKMVAMSDIGRQILQIPLPNGGGNYCPDFKVT